MKLIFRIPITAAFVVALTMVSTTVLQAQDSKEDKASQVKDMIESRHYVFVAESALPLNGRVRQLTSGYQMEVSGDSLTTYLPYFGRAYTPPIDPSKGGIELDTHDFDYNAKENGKDGWNIMIRPKGSQDVQQLALDVFASGRATLQVTSNTRQGISFNGYIKEVKKK